MEKLRLKRMGVMNITPDSFSDGNQLQTPESVLARFHQFGSVDCLDIGAESTAPHNEPVSWQEEWQRWQLVLPLINQFQTTISADTYHPETIFHLVKHWKDQKIHQELFWNDVSGKFDEWVRDFLKEGKRFHYVLCHNRAPKRELASAHMDYVQEDGRIEEELRDLFGPHKHERVIFDPCLGFSKSYDENWFVLENFPKLQTQLKHERWLVGFSRKSFLRKKFQTEDQEELDQLHVKEVNRLKIKWGREVWVRTHRPELL